MSRIIVLTEGQAREIIEQVSTPDYGYHSGDLGKAESFVQYQLGNRDTGHYGTGTYFVGNKDNLKSGRYVDRPVVTHDFSGYNLLKPGSFDLGIRLHDALKYINNTAWLQAKREGSVDIKGLQKALWPLSVMLYSHMHRDEDYNYGPEDVRKFNNEIVVPRAIELLEEYSDFVKQQGGSVTKSDRNTISTELLKSFGIEGIDVRNVPDLDNTEFGSVIFDVRK